MDKICFYCNNDLYFFRDECVEGLRCIKCEMIFDNFDDIYGPTNLIYKDFAFSIYSKEIYLYKDFKIKYTYKILDKFPEFFPKREHSNNTDPSNVSRINKDYCINISKVIYKYVNNIEFA